MCCCHRKEIGLTSIVFLQLHPTFFSRTAVSKSSTITILDFIDYSHWLVIWFNSYVSFFRVIVTIITR